MAGGGGGGVEGGGGVVMGEVGVVWDVGVGEGVEGEWGEMVGGWGSGDGGGVVEVGRDEGVGVG